MQTIDGLALDVPRQAQADEFSRRSASMAMLHCNQAIT
jgi:hypothetical protein